MCFEANPDALVIRVSWVFGPDRPSFVDAILKKARTDEHVAAVVGSPRPIRRILPRWCLLFDFISGGDGILHLATGACSWQGNMRSGRSILPQIRRADGGENGFLGAGGLLGEMKNFASDGLFTVWERKSMSDSCGVAPLRLAYLAVAEYVRDYYRR